MSRLLPVYFCANTSPHVLVHARAGEIAIRSPTHADLVRALSAMTDGELLTVTAPRGHTVRLTSTLVVASAAIVVFQPTDPDPASNVTSPSGQPSGAPRTLVEGQISGASVVAPGTQLTLDCGSKLDVGVLVQSPSVVLQNVAVVGCRMAGVLLQRPQDAAAAAASGLPALTLADATVAGNSGTGIVVSVSPVLPARARPAKRRLHAYPA